MVRGRAAKSVLLVSSAALFLAGCHTDMWVQPHLRAQTFSEFGNFSDHATSRPVVFGTVARGEQDDDPGYDTGRANGKLIDQIPVATAIAHEPKFLHINNFKDFLERGKERFTIYCTPCHGQLGDGQGMIATRGLALKRQPATYHTDRLRKMPVGHFFDVITNGYGVMFSYAARVEKPDRWAIAAYIRVLQMSQNMRASDLPADQRAQIKPEPSAAEEGK